MSNYYPQQSSDGFLNCTYGCENANQCEFNNDQVSFNSMNHYPSQQQFYSNSNFEDGVVPSNLLDNHYQQPQMQLTHQNYVGDSNQFNNNLQGLNFANNNVGFGSENYYYIEQSYAPCRGPRPWNFAECFGFYGEAPCQYANVAVDMEDFM